jgi:hypothetical protein
LIVNTTGTEFQVTNNGVVMGNLSTDNHTITGSLNITGSVGINAASSFRFNGVADTSHAVGYDSTVDGAFLRGQNGVRFLTGTGGGSERMRISAAGTASFTGNSLASAADAATINLKQNSTTANTGIYLERSGEQKGYYIYMGGSVDSLTFQRNNAGTKGDVMSLTRDGNVGIGTTSPSQVLHVSNASNYVGALINGSNAPQLCFAQGSGTSPNWKVGISGNDGTAFSISSGSINADMLTILRSGYVGIGTFAPTRPLYVTGTSTANSIMTNPTAFFGSSNGWLFGDDGTSSVVGVNNSGTDMIFYKRNAGVYAEAMRISANGSIGAAGSTTNIYNASDSRLKKNINTLSYGLNQILELKPVSFNWVDGFDDIEKDKLMLGFIAQDIQSVIPEVVEQYSKEVHLKNDNIIEDVLRINEKFIIPVLVKAIQELKAELDELKNK